MPLKMVISRRWIVQRLWLISGVTMTSIDEARRKLENIGEFKQEYVVAFQWEGNFEWEMKNWVFSVEVEEEDAARTDEWLPENFTEWRTEEWWSTEGIWTVCTISKNLRRLTIILLLTDVIVRYCIVIWRLMTVIMANVWTYHRYIKNMYTIE